MSTDTGQNNKFLYNNKEYENENKVPPMVFELTFYRLRSGDSRLRLRAHFWRLSGYALQAHCWMAVDPADEFFSPEGVSYGSRIGILRTSETRLSPSATSLYNDPVNFLDPDGAEQTPAYLVVDIMLDYVELDGKLSNSGVIAKLNEAASIAEGRFNRHNPNDSDILKAKYLHDGKFLRSCATISSSNSTIKGIDTGKKITVGAGALAVGGVGINAARMGAKHMAQPLLNGTYDLMAGGTDVLSLGTTLFIETPHVDHKAIKKDWNLRYKYQDYDRGDDGYDFNEL